MKKIKLLSIVMAMLLIAGNMYAQTDNTFCFTDANGNEVKDGSTVTFYAEELDPFLAILKGYDVECKLDLNVKNTTGQVAAVAAEITTINKSSGNVKFCFPNQCQSGELPLQYRSDCRKFLGNESWNLNSEWFPEKENYGIAQFKLQLLVVNSLSDIDHTDFTIKGYGPTVNIHCIYADPSGINDLTSDENVTETARYDALGRKLSAPKKGINIVKLSNGKTVKKMIK